MKKTHDIVRYRGNRRLYSKTDSQHVSFGRILEIIQCGDDVRVIDKETGTDITAAILLDILATTAWVGAAFPVKILHDWARGVKSGPVAA